MINTPENINIFIAYTPEDQSFVEELEIHLSVLARLGLVDKIWYDGLVEAGMNWKDTVLNALHNSDIILLLVSADFIASDFCYQEEMLQAVRLHKKGRVQTLPIIVRPCLWDSTPFAQLTVLPQNAVPVASQSWEHRDEPYVQIVTEIEKIILRLKKELIGDDEQKRLSEFNRSMEEAEHYFAAGKWPEAQAKYQNALLFSTKEAIPDLSIINRRIEQCNNETYFQLNFSRGEKAYQEGRYAEARSDLAKALFFKPEDSETQKLIAATEVGTPTSQTRFFQIKLFGIEIFKLVIALSLIGVIIAVLPNLFYSNQVILADVESGTVTYRDSEGRIILKTNYSNGRDFSEGLAAVQNEKGKWGFIDTANNISIDFSYDLAWPHSAEEGLAYVRKKDKCGFIDREGKEKIPLIYLSAFSFSEGLAMVKKGVGDFAFIDANGRERISQLDSVITPAFENGEALVIRNGQRMTIDREGRCLEGCRSIVPESFTTKKRKKKANALVKESEQLRAAKKYERAMMKLEEAQLLAPESTAEETLVLNRMDMVKRKLLERDTIAYKQLTRKADRLFKKGDYVQAKPLYEKAISLKYPDKRKADQYLQLCKIHLRKEARQVSEIYGFKHPINDRWGIKNNNRAVLLVPQFDSVGIFVNDYIAVQKEGAWGFVDKTGKIAITPFYDQVQNFSGNGFAKVKKGRKTYYINRRGTEVDPRGE